MQGETVAELQSQLGAAHRRIAELESLPGGERQHTENEAISAVLESEDEIAAILDQLDFGPMVEEAAALVAAEMESAIRVLRAEVDAAQALASLRSDEVERLASERDALRGHVGDLQASAVEAERLRTALVGLRARVVALEVFVSGVADRSDVPAACRRTARQVLEAVHV